MDLLHHMNTAMKYIEENLTREIDFKVVARLAHCSEYHFKRMFSFLARISLSEYIRRRRLTLAALEFQNHNVKVIDVAMKYGYNSPDSFTRAFLNVHGITPSEARKNGRQLKAYPPMTFQLSIKGGTEMNYRIVEKEGFNVVGVKFEVVMINEILTPTYESMISAISDTEMKELEASSNIEPYGVVHVSVNYSESKEGKATFNQYIGAATSKEPLEKYSVLEVPSLLWAVFEIDGNWEHVEEQWQRIYSEWLPSSLYELAEGPEILASKDQKSEIWISIKEK
ncbi:AraC family transcriptional regulator [Alkalihalophilus pseudofirmus]|uniref:AraC family transcriptional regulator n=1 Tax=Alkalihalophilus pseudofirmus TaxID=79885 RepID=UPI00259B845D|nr:AraC family transcriptional regulator [Alkalihalophilus pseudofirmus]WEG17338.1 AraC family transcriptional regulator [Alkalihalophilus pseudofirmus]